MLIEFSVSNHRSFADEQTFSLVASKLKDDHSDRLVNFDNRTNLQVLTSAILLGKNGSGKSALVNAMAVVRWFVKYSAKEGQRGEELSHNPNLLQADLLNEETYFRLLFSMREKIYQFEFSFDKKRICYEKLSFADNTSRFRKYYEREFQSEKMDYLYTFGDDLKGEKSLWRKSTRENALFLSTAIQLNADILKEPFDWLSQYFRVHEATSSSFTDFTARVCSSSKKKKRIVEFLQNLDINITDINVEEEELDRNIAKEVFRPSFLKKMQADSDGFKQHRIRFVHKNSKGKSVEFDISNESTGTNALFALAGPLFDTLDNGYCLVIDEINTSLHPLILHTLIEAFSDKELNKKRAQLIFTSHDTSLLRDAYFRRDQVWFVDKDDVGCSSLIPLSDYSPRKGEALERGYLKGRYGGVPYISSMTRPHLY